MIYQLNAIVITLWPLNADKALDHENIREFRLEIPLSAKTVRGIVAPDSKSTQIIIESTSTDLIDLDDSESSSVILDESPRSSNQLDKAQKIAPLILSDHEILTILGITPLRRPNSIALKAQVLTVEDIKPHVENRQSVPAAPLEMPPALRMVFYHLIPASVVTHCDKLGKENQGGLVNKIIAEVMLEILAAGNFHGTQKQSYYKNTYSYGSNQDLSALLTTIPTLFADAKKMELGQCPETVQWDSDYPNLIDEQDLSLTSAFKK